MPTTIAAPKTKTQKPKAVQTTEETFYRFTAPITSSFMSVMQSRRPISTRPRSDFKAWRIPGRKRE